jgi:hypothetical protein
MRKCKQCGKKFRAYKRKHTFCSRICFTKNKIKGYTHTTTGYKLIFMPHHPLATKKGYVLEHRLVMMGHLKRNLTKKEVVHHINANRLDNRIENLQIISWADIGKAEKLNTECPKCHHRFRAA